MPSRRGCATSSGLFHRLLDPLYLLEWYALLALAFLAAFTIGYFLPFKWVRASLGFVLLLAGAFVAGGTTMWRHLRDGERGSGKDQQPW